MTHQDEEGERILGEVDLAPEQRDAGAILLRLVQKLERVPRRSRAAAEHADDEARIEAGKLFQGLRAIVYDLEELRPIRLGDPPSERRIESSMKTPISSRLMPVSTLGLNTS